MIVKFDKTNARATGNGAAAVLAEYAKGLGLEVIYAGGALSDTEFTCKFRFRVADKDAQEAAQRAEFNKYCQFFELPPEAYGHVFQSKGRAYRVIGFTGRGKHPLRTCDVLSGKEMLFTEMAIELVKRRVGEGA